MSIFAMLSAVAGFIKLNNLVDKANIDNAIFKAHYKFTTAMLIACSILVTANHLIGEPISCMTDGTVPAYFVNNFCWISHTFTLPDKIGKGLGTHVPHPGVSNYIDNEDQVRYHSYYQWVPFILFFQGILFYVPHWFWKCWEQGKLCMITEGVRGTTIGDNEERQYLQNKLVQYLINSLHKHNLYASRYYLCEVFNFLNVIGNMFLIDKFLGGEFFTYGFKVLSYSQMDQENRDDPLVAVFPRVTKCTFQKYGPSGSIQKHDALCVLALNILNEKIYIFLWFWFIILAAISGMALVYSFAVVTMPSIRKIILLRRFKFGTPQSVSILLTKTQMGDFFLLHLLGQNMHIAQFAEVLEELSSRLYDGKSIPTVSSTIELSTTYSADTLTSHIETETKT